MIKLFPTSLLVDANILIRSTFNQGPKHFLRFLSDRNIDLYSIMSIWQEVEKHLPEISRDRNTRMLQERLQERKKYIDLIQGHLEKSAPSSPGKASWPRQPLSSTEFLMARRHPAEGSCPIFRGSLKS